MPLLKGKTVHRLRRLLRAIPRKRVRSFLAILPLSAFNGLLDLGSVAVAARLAGTLVGKNLNDSIPGINVFNGSSSKQTLWLILILVLLSWLGSATKLILRVTQEKLTAQVWRDISDRILRKIVGQPYEYFLTAKSSAISAQIMANMQRLSEFIVCPLLLISSSSITITFLAIALGLTLGLNAIILLALLGLAFLGISSLVVPYLRHASRQRVRLDILANSLLNQIFYSIRDIHLTQTGNYFESRFVKAGQAAKSFDWISRLLPDIPRLIIEPLAITFIFAVALIPLLGNSSTEDIAVTLIPFVSTFVVASVKLTPPLQDLFRSITRLRGTLPEVDSALSYLELPNPKRAFSSLKGLSPDGIFPRREISLYKVGYRYPESDQAALRSISINVPVGSRVALMGPTGSGKTTLSSILLAHLEPTTGQIRLDGIPLASSDISSWQQCCSEVPQNINLLDASILENIAFGKPEEQINYDEVWDAISAAQLYEVVADMPHGLYTCIGENGVNLSGGQRQRLALARAFYRKTKFLILDEATNSLDEKTEADVINSLEIIGRRCTTVVIAHRLNTLSKCDKIYEIKNGLVASYGSYTDLCDPSHPLGESVKGSNEIEI